MAQINPDLQKERDTATFDILKLSHQLDGNEGITDRRREMESLALQETEFTDGPDYNFMSRSEKYDRGVRKAVHYIKCLKKYDLVNPGDSYWFGNMIFPNEASPATLHFAMFLPSIRNLGTEEQKDKWLPLAENHEIIGTYAQTEMGHGTFVRGLETTATYDSKTEEFVLHSPTLTATKWWPGGLGKTSNFAIVMALLYTNGQNHGMHGFIVQLRSMENHQPLPGIIVGDIGPKIGFDTIDNGFLRFDQVRISRDCMLMKNAQVLKDGTYVKAKNDKLSYGTMVFVRSMIIHDVAARGLAQACTIATRYSAVRRQSELKKGEPEIQIFDFQTQQYKLLPLLASAYAIWFTGLHMREMYFSTNYEIQQGNTELLPELHGLSSGLKAFTTDMANWGMERCRLACGGHGYSHASGIPKIYVHSTAGCTYEGETTVMLLQSARYLIKMYQMTKEGQTVIGSVEYLNDQLTSRSSIAADFSLQSLIEAYQHRAARLIGDASARLARLQSQGNDQYDAWNNNSVMLSQAAQAHCHYYLVKVFIDALDRTEEESIADVLKQLCQLFAAHGIIENTADFTMDGFLSNAQVELVRNKMFSLLTDIRPNAVALVDAFDFRDEMLCSILGRYDGNVYENLYKWAANSPLNKDEVHETYRKYLQPLMQSTQSKL